MLDQANDVQEALGRSYGVPDVDEAELEAGEWECCLCNAISFEQPYLYANTELEALGDELSADTDTSYLDDALQAPSAPTRDPGESVNAVRSYLAHCFNC